MTSRAQRLASPDLAWRFVVRVHRYADLLCVLFVVLGAAIWWQWSEGGRHRKQEARPVEQRMTWLVESPSDVAGAWQSDVRALSSPVLFALPTPLGFSRGALSDPGLSLPAASEAGTAMREMSAPTSLVARIARTMPNESAAAARSLAWPMIAGDAPPAVAGPTSPALVVVWKRDGVAAQTCVMPVATNSAWIDEQPWEAVARLDLDERGWADRVLLEKATLVTNRNAMLVQLLRTMNFGSTGSRSARAAVRIEGGGGVRNASAAKEPRS